MAFDLVVLGSGTLAPESGRAPSCHLVEAEGFRLLLDCGPSAPLRLAESGCALHDLDAVAISHLHPDHCAGLIPLLQGTWGVPGYHRSRALPLGGPEPMPDLLARLSEQWPSIGRAIEHIAQVHLWQRDGVMKAGPFTITPVPVRHHEGSVALRVDGPGGSLLYTGDCDDAEPLVEAARGVDLLLTECGRAIGSSFPAHLSAEDIAQVAARAQIPRVVLVHFLPEVDPEEAAAVVGNVARATVADDLQRFSMGA